jgi:2-hydroxychromene-2-carboxylate isomerase
VDEAAFYFDPISPFAFLAWKMLRRAPLPCPVRPVPVVFGALLAHWGQLGPAEIAPKRLHTYRYCQWLADREGIPFRFPPAHPFRSLEALRLVVALGESDAATDAVFDAVWVEALDLGTAEGMAALTARLGGAALAEAARSEAVKRALQANTEAAAARGVFGVPTLALGDELFWGLDALGMARDYLADPALFEAPEMRRLPALPVGVVRRR